MFIFPSFIEDILLVNHEYLWLYQYNFENPLHNFKWLILYLNGFLLFWFTFVVSLLQPHLYLTLGEAKITSNINRPNQSWNFYTQIQILTHQDLLGLLEKRLSKWTLSLFLLHAMACIVLYNSPYEYLIMKAQSTMELCTKIVPTNEITTAFVHRIHLKFDNALWRYYLNAQSHYVWNGKTCSQ